MAQKLVDIPGVGEVTLAKRKGSRNLRITIRPDGSVRVGMPYWAPYEAGIRFAKSRADWIVRHKPKNIKPLLSDGTRIGKSYRLELRSAPGLKVPRVKLAGNSVIVNTGGSITDVATQLAAAKACEKALRMDAENLLRLRLDQLATVHGFKYKKLSIKKLKSRWGSCSSKQEISLNYYLIQLPWRLIDYVILHELVHTQHMNHSHKFWHEVELRVPNLSSCRKEIKNFRPLLSGVNA